MANRGGPTDCADRSRLPPLIGANQSLDLSPDGSLLAFASRDRIFVRDLSRRQVLYLLAFQNPVTGLRFDPSGETLVSASTGGEVSIVNARTGETLKRFPGPASRITLFSGDGRLVARAARGEVAVAAASDQASPLLSYGQDDNVTSLAFDADSGLVASGGQGGMVRIWNVIERRELLRHGFRSKVLALGFNADGKILTVITGDGEVARLPVSYTSPVAEACRALRRDLTLEEWRRYLPDEPYRRRCAL